MSKLLHIPYIKRHTERWSHANSFTSSLELIWHSCNGNPIHRTHIFRFRCSHIYLPAICFVDKFENFCLLWLYPSRFTWYHRTLCTIYNCVYCLAKLLFVYFVWVLHAKHFSHHAIAWSWKEEKRLDYMLETLETIKYEEAILRTNALKRINLKKMRKNNYQRVIYANLIVYYSFLYYFFGFIGGGSVHVCSERIGKNRNEFLFVWMHHHLSYYTKWIW